MITRIVALLLCLIGITDLCLADGFVPGRKYFVNNSYTTRPVKTKTFESLPFKVQAEKKNIWVEKDAQIGVLLRGNARVFCGETCFSADSIEVIYKDEHDLRIDLKGNVKIENERDQLRMLAQHAGLEYGGRFLRLSSGDRGYVSLIRTQNRQTTEIKASHILMKYKDLHTMLVHPIENVNMIERQATPEDVVTVEKSEPSQFDFFDQIAISQIKLFSYDWSVRAEKPYLQN